MNFSDLCNSYLNYNANLPTAPNQLNTNAQPQPQQQPNYMDNSYMKLLQDIATATAMGIQNPLNTSSSVGSLNPYAAGNLLPALNATLQNRTLQLFLAQQQILAAQNQQMQQGLLYPNAFGITPPLSATASPAQQLNLATAGLTTPPNSPNAVRPRPITGDKRLTIPMGHIPVSPPETPTGLLKQADDGVANLMNMRVHRLNLDSYRHESGSGTDCGSHRRPLSSGSGGGGGVGGGGGGGGGVGGGGGGVGGGGGGAACMMSSIMHSPNDFSVGHAVNMHKNAAAKAKVIEKRFTELELPMIAHENPTYSGKVFLGGVPWDITEDELRGAIQSIVPKAVSIQWPEPKDGKPRSKPGAKGYAYAIFREEDDMRELLHSPLCEKRYPPQRVFEQFPTVVTPAGLLSNQLEIRPQYYIRVSSARMQDKEVQLIPWIIEDSMYFMQNHRRLPTNCTVFVGALHGMITALGLGIVMNDLFGDVVFSAIDTDKHKYPIGSGRVTFGCKSAFNRAVDCGFIEIETNRFTKKIQIDPYLEEQDCSGEGCREAGPYFCRDRCKRYLCERCWESLHRTLGEQHKALMRNSKKNEIGPSMDSLMMNQLRNMSVSNSGVVSHHQPLPAPPPRSPLSALRELGVRPKVPSSTALASSGYAAEFVPGSQGLSLSRWMGAAGASGGGAITPESSSRAAATVDDPTVVVDSPTLAED